MGIDHPNITPYLEALLNSKAAGKDKHSIQFFTRTDPKDDNVNPTPHGSGVLLSYEGRHYIATAAHVLQTIDGKHIGVFTPVDGFFELGPSCWTPDSNIDIAIWQVEPHIAVEIACEDRWYPLDQCLLHHEESSEVRYYIHGFPAKKIRIDKATKAIHQYPLCLRTRGYSANPQSRNATYNPEIHLLLEFHQKKILNERTRLKEHAPYPYGMSGCGLWYFDGFDYRLVGIMTEWKQKTESVPALMATKIDFVLEAIRHLENHSNPPKSI